VGGKSGFAPPTAFERGGTQRNAEWRRGKQPITTTTAQTPRNNSVEFERPMLRKTFAFLRAASALSAIKVF
jgi:hypothetical protein